MQHYVEVRNSAGEKLTELANFVAVDGPGLEYVLTCAPGNIGALVMTLPPTVSLDYFKKDGWVVPFRSIAGRPAIDNGAVYLIRKRELFSTYTKITALHATSILQRRIINYRSGLNASSGLNYTGKGPAAAEDVIYEYVDENIGTGISLAQRIGNQPLSVRLTNYDFFTLAASAGGGASVSMEAAWRNLAEVCAELANYSASQGSYLTYEIVSPADGTLEFRQYTSQRGVDRRASSTNPLIFSVDTGTIENAVLTEDWTDEKTQVTAGGAGDGQARAVNGDYDFVRDQESAFGYIESFVEDSNQADETKLLDSVNAALNAARGVTTLAADLVETSGATRGLHYDLGDYVTILHRGVQYDVRLDTIHVAIGGAQTSVGVAMPIGERSDAWRGQRPPRTYTPGKRRERMIARV